MTPPRLAMIVMLATLAVVPPAHADPSPRYVYTWLGYRGVVGVEDLSGPTVGAGYRRQRGMLGLDVSILNLQLGGVEGLHGAARLIGYVDLRTPVRADLWVGGGLSYGWAYAWTDAPLAKRTGHGFQLELLAGYDLARTPAFRIFGQLGVTAPLYRMRDVHGSMATSRYALGIELAVGVGF